MSGKKTSGFRTTLGRVRGLGSAQSGTHHWQMMKMTSVALLLLALYPILGFFIYAVYGGHAGAVEWLRSPFNATGVILFVVVGFHHAAHGLQVVIEDYVHGACTKSVSLLIVKFIAASFAILGVLATLKVMLGV